MVANSPAIMKADAQPRRDRKDDTAHQRRMRMGGRALLAAAASIPAAGAVSAQEAAFNTFTGPQAYITQVQDTGGDAPAVAPATTPTPGELGAVCIAVASQTNATGALMLVSPDGTQAIGVATAGPGTLPETPDGIECISSEEFTEGVRTRMTSFAHDTSDYMQEIAARAGISTGPAAALKNPALNANPVATWQRTAQQFTALNNLIVRMRGPEEYQQIIDSERSDALIKRYQEMGAELTMIGLMARSLPTVQERLDNGTFGVNDRFSPLQPEADEPEAEPIRFESGPETPRVIEARAAAPKVETPALTPGVDNRRRLTA
ncbi:MAG: hypothetical protein AAF213_09260 [Pseudomonadota bacterium]